MIKYNIVCVGNLKDKFFIDAQNEFVKRLSAFSTVNIIEVAEKTKEDNIDITLEKEAQLLEKHLAGYVVLLDIGGKEMSSEHFAVYLKTLELEESVITFVIGGSYGVHQRIKDVANARLSFSKMTFPHRLARIMLLEQLYRANMISANRSYHK